jgi:hypothetical protein
MIGFLCVRIMRACGTFSSSILSPLAVTWTPWPRLLGRRVHRLG